MLERAGRGGGGGAGADLIDSYRGRKRERPLRGRHLIPISAAGAIKSSSEMNSGWKKGRNKTVLLFGKL